MISEIEKIKRRLRQSKRWKQLRTLKVKEQEGLDFITQKKLNRMANCHHLDQRAEKYEDISDTRRFVMLNKKTHEVVHFLYSYYSKDKTVINRIVFVLDEMIRCSND